VAFTFYWPTDDFPTDNFRQDIFLTGLARVMQSYAHARDQAASVRLSGNHPVGITLFITAATRRAYYQQDFDYFPQILPIFGNGRYPPVWQTFLCQKSASFSRGPAVLQQTPRCFSAAPPLFFGRPPAAKQQVPRCSFSRWLLHKKINNKISFCNILPNIWKIKMNLVNLVIKK
jgi:hypothetical protein